MALMMIPNEGKLKWLTWALVNNAGGIEDLHVHLYQNNYTPVDGSTLANFTESTFAGYAAEPLVRTNFGAPVLVGNVAYSTYPTDPTFVCTAGGPQLVYGWWMDGDVSGKVYAAARFDNTRSMAAGATETLSPFAIGLKTFV
jgi:hypothetical protein